MEIYKNKEFTCVLKDGSIIQTFFKLNRDNLKEASFQFFPNPGLSLNDDYSIDEYHYDFIANNISYYTSKYVRMDFNSSGGAYKEILHPCGHIHIGLEGESRIAINKFPFFSEFIMFISFLYYKKDWVRIVPNAVTDSESKSYDFQDYIRMRMRNSTTKYIDCVLTDKEKGHYLLSM